MASKLLKLMLLVVVALTLLGTGAEQAQAGHFQGTCSQPTRLAVGGQGRVTTFPNLPNRVRAYPSFAGSVVGYIPAGGVFSVLGGPVCQQGTWWWQVNYNGLVGWTGEGNGYGTYWLEPVAAPPACALVPRLTVGGQGRVTPGLPNVVRNAPGTQSSGANSVVIGYIPGGGIFSVLGGPTCGPDARWWWYVNYNGLVGWTAEGEGSNTYWVEPYSNLPPHCPGALVSRLQVGGAGRVTLVPALPNRVRSGPGYGYPVVGHIPAGGVFTVLSGPTCSQGTAWWQVNYNGLIGWTAESSPVAYFLEPF